MAAAVILKNRQISASVSAISTKFCHGDAVSPLDRSDSYKFEILKTQDGGGHHPEKLKITISRQRFDRLTRNLVW